MIAIAQYQQQLRERARHLRREITEVSLRTDAERRALLAEQVHDTKDQSQLDALMRAGAAEIARDAQELQDVEGALDRLHNGQFGVCTDCGDSIAAARLTAYPTAKRCQPCQQRHEQRRAV
jgi:DnaK suppressor protein